jgi:hypothetical protein
VIEGCRQLDKETRIFGLPTDFKEGVIFSTYATLVSSVQRGCKSVLKGVFNLNNEPVYGVKNLFKKIIFQGLESL